MDEIKSLYNYEDVITWIEKKGQELYGSHFNIMETDHPVVYRLIAYFLKDEQTAFRYNLDLNKGIILSGPVGCGKTSLLTIMKHLTLFHINFRLNLAGISALNLLRMAMK